MSHSLVDISKTIGYKFPSVIRKYSFNDLILYALSIGFNKDPLNTRDFKFTYERDQNFQSFFTFPVIAGHVNLGKPVDIPGIPHYDHNQLLHGEENIEIQEQIKPNTPLKVTESIVDIQDKGKMTALFVESSIQDEHGSKLYSKLSTTLMLRGLGGFGYKGKMKNVYPDPPQRQPDLVAEEKTLDNQALLYRLNGDPNALHIDPSIASLAKFNRPILHGLCSLGFTARSVYEKMCEGNQDKVKKWGTRFTAHVFPGETFVVEMWKEGNNVIYQTKTKERGEIALKGYVELKDNLKI